eukprot:scaffold87945_cov54-Phaeocystis_antarctica.AAC.1
MPLAAPSVGQPRPISRSGRIHAGRPPRACFGHRHEDPAQRPTMSACAKRLLQLVRAADVISVVASDDPLKLKPDMAADSMRVDGCSGAGLEAGGVSLEEVGVAALMAEANAAPLREDRMPSFKSTTSEEDEAMETG